LIQTRGDFSSKYSVILLVFKVFDTVYKLLLARVSRKEIVRHRIASFSNVEIIESI